MNHIKQTQSDFLLPKFSCSCSRHERIIFFFLLFTKPNVSFSDFLLSLSLSPSSNLLSFLPHLIPITFLGLNTFMTSLCIAREQANNTPILFLLPYFSFSFSFPSSLSSFFLFLFLSFYCGLHSLQSFIVFMVQCVIRSSESSANGDLVYLLPEFASKKIKIIKRGKREDEKKKRERVCSLNLHAKGIQIKKREDGEKKGMKGRNRNRKTFQVHIKVVSCRRTENKCS